MKPTRTWVLVADGARGRVFQRTGAEGSLEAAPGGVFEHELHKTSDMVSDRTGRVYESVGGAHHGVAAKTDWHRLEKSEFARKLAGHLEGAAERNEFDRLVLVAAPRTLGDLREALGRHARDRLDGTLDKDLTDMTMAEIEARLVEAALL